MKSPPPPHSLKFKTSIHFQLPNLSLSSSLLFPPKSHHTHQSKQLGSLPPPHTNPLYSLFQLTPLPNSSSHTNAPAISLKPSPTRIPVKPPAISPPNITHQSKQLGLPPHALPPPFSPALAWHPAAHSSLSPSFHQRSLKAPNLFLLTSPPISKPHLSFIKKHA